LAPPPILSLKPLSIEVVEVWDTLETTKFLEKLEATTNSVSSPEIVSDLWVAYKCTSK
jgi:hypothetical protein